MKNKLKIFLSKEENFMSSALKIKEEAPIETEIIYMEDFIKKGKYDLIENNDIVYFLSNVKLVSEFISKIDKTDCFIINKEFWMKKYLKDEVQKILYRNEIKVPEIIPFDKIKKDSFPLFCKQKKHTGITFQTYNEFTLTSFFEKFEKREFYLEKAINNKETICKETKVYYVNGEIYSQDGKQAELNDNIQNICNKISKCLEDMDIFSVDFIKISNEYYIIDINPASGFYLSSDARKAWFKEMEGVKEKCAIMI